MVHFLPLTILLVACYAPEPRAGSSCANSPCPFPLVCAQASLTCEVADVDAGLRDARVIDAPIDAGSRDAPASAPSRITMDLVALWDFAEGSGTVVGDTSGVGVALDLVINGTVTWLSDALRIDADTIITSDGPATKVISAVVASNELTVEVWFVPANLAQGGPARLVTCSINTGARNFQVAQELGQFNARVRSTTTGLNGSAPELTAGSVDLALTHYVMTRNAAGQVRLYENGIEIASAAHGGSVSNWDPTYRLALANELTRDRDWLGELHLVAIYSRALSPAQIVQNFDAGSTAP